MGGGRIPGGVCSFLSDAGWQEDGTNCLGPSPTAGPVGMDADADVAAAKKFNATAWKNVKQPKSDLATQEFIKTCIQLIEDSPFGKNKIDLVGTSPLSKANDGTAIIALLKKLNNNHNITFGNTNSARGDWGDGHIRISNEFLEKGESARKLVTAIELVHEGSHALRHANRAASNVEDEYLCQLHQLAMYRHLRDTQNHFDLLLDLRQDRLSRDTLRMVIENGSITD